MDFVSISPRHCLRRKRSSVLPENILVEKRLELGENRKLFVVQVCRLRMS